MARPFRRDIARHTARELAFEFQSRCVEPGHGIGVFLPGDCLIGANGQLLSDVGEPALDGALRSCIGGRGDGNDTDRAGCVRTAVADRDTGGDPQDR